MAPVNGDGIRIEGRRYPWSVIILLLAFVGNAAVNLYKLNAVEERLDQHEDLAGHHEMDSRVTGLEQNIKHLEWRLDQQTQGRPNNGE